METAKRKYSYAARMDGVSVKRSCKDTQNRAGLIIDNFAGGGGASEGIEQAMGRPVDAAINHDPDAIAMHMLNHPKTKHYCESVWEIEPYQITKGRPVDLAWFSPDCKHFSKAKGGKPKNKNIRGLAWVAVKWAWHVRPKVIILENVEEFKTWGPLGEDGQPIKEKEGETFKSFVEELRNMKYAVEWRELKACDYGAPTTRKRFFMVARCDGRPIIWPEKTHGPGTGNPYHTAKEIIDWSLPCPSIFTRKKPLAESTMRRIHRGIFKYVINNPEPFIININHSQTPFIGNSINEPLRTVMVKNCFAIVAPTLIQMGYGDPTGKRALDLNKPLGTVTAQGNKFALAAAFIKKDYGTGTGQSAEEPLHTITASSNHFSLVSAFLLKYYGCGNGQSIEEPLHTITTKDRFGLVTVQGQKYRIADIGMRMLEPRELFRGQGFRDSYIIDTDINGKKYSKAKQVAKCGNAVPPPLARALVMANCSEYAEKKSMKSGIVFRNFKRCENAVGQ